MYFEKARYYMVEQQIRPWNVFDLNLLNVLSQIPREKFVLPEQLEIAYAELSLPLKNGSRMLEPKILARLVQSLEISLKDEVLEIGTGSGYATAVLAKLAKQVDTLDKDSKQLKFAQNVLDEIAFENINFYAKDGLIKETYQELGKQYDAIYIGGAVHSVPAFLLDILKPNGRLIAIIGKTPIMQAVLHRRNGTEVTEKSLFETNAHYLQKDLDSFKKKFVF